MSRVYFIQLCERFNTGVSGPFYRSWGKALIGAGLKLMGPEYQEQSNIFSKVLYCKMCERGRNSFASGRIRLPYSKNECRLNF